MSNLAEVLILPGAVLFIAALYLLFKSPSRKLPYPPGPTPLPLIGNALDIPLKAPWATFLRWGREYGDIVHLSTFGMHLIIINSLDVAVELMEHRSNNYSDRPHLPLADLSGWSINIATIGYNDLWRNHRRLYHQRFRRQAIPALHPLLLSKTHQILRSYMENPDDHKDHAQYLAAAEIMYITYGHEIAPRNDPIVTAAMEAAKMVAETILHNLQFLNILPSLVHVPSWMPSAGFQHMAKVCREKVDIMQNVPFQSVRRHMANGTAVPCWLTELLEENDGKGGGKEQEDVIKAVTATSFAAAGHTTSAALEWFLVAMIQYPHVQKKAQAEIDQVVGHDRLPNFEDQSSLPYITALCNEILRWRPPAIIGVPHAAVNDDSYNGYYIPKGSMVFGNVWGICHNEKVYENPETVMPERFLESDGSLKTGHTPWFGFGRRICVGRALADDSLWIVFTSMLSVFNISKALDESGQEIDVSGEHNDGMIVHPLPFKCSIKVRSEQAKRLIMNPPEFKLDSMKMA